jgi:uncharacterized protein
MKGSINMNLPKITSAFFVLTGECNLRCEYCFVQKNPVIMDYKVALDATNFLIKNAEMNKQTPSINFFGGEPLLRWKEIIVPLTNYIRQIYKKPFRLSMTSNCVLMDREKLEFMKANNIGLLFSIDGDRETMAINRPLIGGQNSFDILEKKIPLILEYYPNMTFRATISNKTSEHTFNNIKFAFDNNYSNAFFVPNVFVKWTSEEKEILRSQMRLFGDYFIENARKGRVIKLNPFNEKLFEVKKVIMDKGESKANRRKHIGSGKCGLGASMFASVSPNGKLYGCQELVCNEKDGLYFEIGDIYKGEDEQKRLKLANSFSIDMVKSESCNCDICIRKNICDGGCVANNYMITGNINTQPDMLCCWYKILFNEAMRVTEVLESENNELFLNTYYKK